MTGASRVAAGLRFAPCPPSAFGRPLTLLVPLGVQPEVRSHARSADRVETFFTSSRAPASPALPPLPPASGPAGRTRDARLLWVRDSSTAREPDQLGFRLL